jgi:methionine-S-sulfoxide reductase
MSEIYLAGGCFWGAEKYLSLIPGVLKTEAGYANGNTANPSYEEVCRSNTGHAETVKVSYDRDTLDLSFLLELFYDAIDPTTLNRQGHDAGVQYRTGIYYTDADDKPLIDASLASLQSRCEKPVQIESGPLKNFYSAEEYHQKYLDKNPGGYCHIGSGTFASLKEKLRRKGCAPK